jgi:hypothetical protein
MKNETTHVERFRINKVFNKCLAFLMEYCTSYLLKNELIKFE